MLQVQHLTKVYGRNSKPAIEDVTFDVNNGEVVGFVGLNGAGKTTTIRIAAGVTLPTRGNVIVDGNDIVAEKVEASKRIGWVPELPNFDPNGKAIDLMKYYGGYYGIESKRASDLSYELLKAFGLEGFEKKKVGSYSQGMKKRFSLAASMLSDPPNYLFDEILNGLDPEGIHYFRKIVTDFRDRGKAVLLSSHILTEIEGLSDRVVLIHKGKVIKIITKGDLSSFKTGVLLLKLDRYDDDLFHYLNSLGNPKKDDGTITVSDFSGDPSLVNSELVRRGYAVQEISLRKMSLEEFFLKLVGDVQ